MQKKNKGQIVKVLVTNISPDSQKLQKLVSENNGGVDLSIEIPEKFCKPTEGETEKSSDFQDYLESAVYGTLSGWLKKAVSHCQIWIQGWADSPSSYQKV
jgi:hypothetical protein